MWALQTRRTRLRREALRKRLAQLSVKSSSALSALFPYVRRYFAVLLYPPEGDTVLVCQTHTFMQVILPSSPG